MSSSQQNQQPNDDIRYPTGLTLYAVVVSVWLTLFIVTLVNLL